MREMERAERAWGQFAVVLLDFDHFKWINDQHGHLVGDLALKAVSRVLRETTRSYDICARYGGDEFVVLLASCGQAEAEERCRVLQEAVAAIPFAAPDGRLIPLGMSAGVGVFPADGDSYERLLVKADRRMYQEKARRKRTSLKALVDVSRHERVRPFRAS